jgi:hypothetical protein
VALEACSGPRRRWPLAGEQPGEARLARTSSRLTGHVASVRTRHGWRPACCRSEAWIRFAVVKADRTRRHWPARGGGRPGDHERHWPARRRPGCEESERASMDGNGIHMVVTNQRIRLVGHFSISLVYRPSRVCAGGLELLG